LAMIFHESCLKLGIVGTHYQMHPNIGMIHEGPLANIMTYKLCHADFFL